MLFEKKVDAQKRINPYIFLFLLYIPLIFMGYGSDNDTYSVLDTWKKFLLTKDYVPSRLPGYVIHEFGTYLFAKIGGSVLSNLVTLLFSILICLIFIKILRMLSLPDIAVLLLILNPVYIVNSTSTTDYLWAMCFFVGGIYLLLKKKILFANVCLGMAAAIRLSYGLLVLGVFIYFFFVYFKEDHKVFKTFLPGALVILAINFAAYYLPMDFTEWRMSLYLHASVGDASLWSPLMRIGRWGYKNLLFWGIPTVLLILCLFASRLKSFKQIREADNKIVVWCSIIILVLTEIIFFFYPIEIEYLFPILPFTALLMAMLFKEKKGMIALLAILIFLNGFYSINLAQPNKPNQASSAKVQVSLSQGYLVNNAAERLSLIHCSSLACYGSVKSNQN
jgi:hypothetical protein